MKTFNSWIATQPFPETSIKTFVSRGVGLIDQSRKLTKLRVMYPAYSTDGKHLFQPGNHVFVKGESMKHQWATEILEDEHGTKFILIPMSIVMAATEE